MPGSVSPGPVVATCAAPGPVVADPALVGVEPDVAFEPLGALEDPVAEPVADPVADPAGELAAEGPGAGVRPYAHPAPTPKTTANTRPRTRCTTTVRGMQFTPISDGYVLYAGLSVNSRPHVDWLFMRSCRIVGMRTTATLFMTYFT
jgi:hypothetical protein